MKHYLLICCLLLSGAANGNELQKMVAAGNLRLNAWFQTTGQFVVGQELQLVIEVATQRWFAGGTHIQIPEVPQLIILQRDQFASNLNARENGVSWVKQRWGLELYPQREGDYQVPPIHLELSVSDAKAGAVHGDLYTQALSFSAVIPAPLEAAESWTASPKFEAMQSIDRKLTGLKPGDAIRREIEFSATMLTSMMLPVAETTAAEGLAAYAEIPKLSDKSNRGEASAHRKEVIVYVVEQAGQYYLPEQTYYWWNTQTQSASTVVLPALEIDAGVAATGAAATAVKKTPSTPGQFPNTPQLIALSIVLLLLLFALRQRRSADDNINFLTQARRAQARGDAKFAIKMLYQWLNNIASPRTNLSLRETSEKELGETQAAAAIELLAQCYQDTSLVQTVPTFRLKTRRAFRPKLPTWLKLALTPKRALGLNPEHSAAAQKAS